MGGIHSDEDQYRLGRGGFIQLGGDEIQSKAALGISASFCDRIVVTGIFIPLSILFSVSSSGFRTTQSQTRQMDSFFFAECSICVGLVNFSAGSAPRYTLEH